MLVYVWRELKRREDEGKKRTQKKTRRREQRGREEEEDAEAIRIRVVYDDICYHMRRDILISQLSRDDSHSHVFIICICYNRIPRLVGLNLQLNNSNLGNN